MPELPQTPPDLICKQLETITQSLDKLIGEAHNLGAQIIAITKARLNTVGHMSWAEAAVRVLALLLTSGLHAYVIFQLMSWWVGGTPDTQVQPNSMLIVLTARNTQAVVGFCIALPALLASFAFTLFICCRRREE